MLESQSRSLDGAIIVEYNILSKLFPTESVVLAARGGDLNIHELPHLFFERKEFNTPCSTIILPPVASNILREGRNP